VKVSNRPHIHYAQQHITAYLSGNELHLPVRTRTASYTASDIMLGRRDYRSLMLQ
jgi:hypothetical protein